MFVLFRRVNHTFYCPALISQHFFSPCPILELPRSSLFTLSVILALIVLAKGKCKLSRMITSFLSLQEILCFRIIKKKKELHCASKHISLKVNHVGDILAYFYNHIADH